MIENFPHPLLQIFLLILNLLFLFWTFVEADRNQIRNKIKIDFISKLRLFIEKKKGHKFENLFSKYPDVINRDKDLYYINRDLIIKTGNTNNNGQFVPPGISLRMGKFKLIWLKLSRAVQTILEIEIFKYMVRLIWGGIMVNLPRFTGHLV